MSLALSAWAGAVAWCDARTRRIPGWLLLLALVPAVVFLVAAGRGLAGGEWLDAVAGLGLAAAFTLPAWWAKALGAGDVKMAMVAGLLLGPARTLEMLIVAALVQGIASAVVLARDGRTARHRRLPAGPGLALGLVVELAGGAWLI